MKRINFQISESVAAGFANLGDEGKILSGYVRAHSMKVAIRTALCAGVFGPVGIAVFSTY